MQDWLIIAGMLAGGLGLFMLAVTMITDGLKVAAGNTLRDMLSRWTRTLSHGIATGVTITAIVQSSSAVTVATIGFVNAGLLSLYQALGVVFGANIGTTMTGWLVAVIGFNFKVEAFALPLIGIGMILRLTGGDSRRAPIGLALAGFGLFFIGIDVLKDAFEGLASAINLEELKFSGLAGLFIYVGIGFLMTLLTQSSSAAIAITLTAATGGVLDLHSSAAMVIGANVGTTSTALIAVIGATSNAKRVASAHILFNLLTGIVAILILPGLFWLIDMTSNLLGLAQHPAMTLALFHTVFNILGVLLMWPVSTTLAAFLEKRFVTAEEIEARPRHLDKNIAVSPKLALNALVLELLRILAIARRMSLAVMSMENSPARRFNSDLIVIESLAKAVSDFIARLGRESLDTEITDQLRKLLLAEQHILECAELVEDISVAQTLARDNADIEAQDRISQYRAEAVLFFQLADPENPEYDIARSREQFLQVKSLHDETREWLLHLATTDRIPVSEIIEVSEQNARIRRLCKQMLKALDNIGEVLDTESITLSDKSAENNHAGNQSAGKELVSEQGV